MKRNFSYSDAPSSRETVAGFCYLAFQMLALPAILSWVNAQLSYTLTETELNFVFYLVNFIAILLIFHDFLSRALTHVFQHPILFAEAVILGAVAYYALFWLTDTTVSLLVPGFSNHNDESIMAMLRSSRLLMLVGTVVLVPITEECLFRGVVFRGLYDRSPVLSWLISTVVFSLVHIAGYIGQYDPMMLLMAFLQYLPAGICLAYAHKKADTILSPILMHIAINQVALNLL